MFLINFHIILRGSSSSYILRPTMLKFNCERELIIMEKETEIYNIPCENGYYQFKLEDVLKKRKKTKYVLAKQLDSEYKVINRYIRGNLTRLDLSILAKICDFCDCKLVDILEYIPNTENKGKRS